MTELRKEQLLIADNTIPWTDLGDGVKRKVMARDGHLMLVKVAFETGAVGILHHHYHRQLSYVESGVFELTIGPHKQVLRGGDVYFVPPDVPHGALCMEAGTLIDVFSPERADFLPPGFQV